MSETKKCAYGLVVSPRPEKRQLRTDQAHLVYGVEALPSSLLLSDSQGSASKYCKPVYDII